MRRLAATVIIAALAVSPMAADLTLVTVTTLEGALTSGQAGGLNPKVTIRISGTKSRMDVDTGDQVVTTIVDTATNQGYVLRPEEKSAVQIQIDAPAAGDGAAAAPADVSVKPTGQKREIDGQSCDEYSIAMKLPLAALAAGGAGALPPEAVGMLKDVTLGISGSVWSAKDAPGAADYAGFKKATSRLAAALARRAPGDGTALPIPQGMDQLFVGFPDVPGIPFLNELTTKLEGTGQLVALMQQMGQLKITGKVSSVSTEPVAADVFTLPEGYTIVK
jgi:hypothetical protein